MRSWAKRPACGDASKLSYDLPESTVPQAPKADKAPGPSP